MLCRIPTTARLSERDVAVLKLLVAACDRYIAAGRDPWVRPMDCGATDRSYHVDRLRKLVRHGWAAWRLRGLPEQRAAYVYTVTERGRRAAALFPDAP